MTNNQSLVTVGQGFDQVQTGAEWQGKNPASAYVGALGKSSQRVMASALQHAANIILPGSHYTQIPWHLMQSHHVEAIRSRLLEEGLAPATINRTLCALRGVFKRARKMRLIDYDQYTDLIDIDAVRGSTIPAGRALSVGEINALLQSVQADETPAGTRDTAIIALGYGCGLRRAELSGLDYESILSDDGEGILLKIVGKGSKERTMYVENGTYTLLKMWLDVRGIGPGPMFWQGRKGGRVTRDTRMSATAIRNMLAMRAEQATVAHLTPHDLRRTFATDLLDSGVPITVVAALMGHASVETTGRYDRSGEQAKQRAVGNLHVPVYRKRGG